ncbi:chain length determinant protein tyrosine kinase EpsG [Aquitalea sp. LB_tupeE]|uniref:chain length determinant protein tyrosine kinase EpsG n=1 Tax=Aquitalea sp. LB_tupeE TaxID=2748078 RepID=UPI0015B8D166|nr:chain length determinant protein tyrosine kinase EpsG [Aquitalea sp. LB_tupeE]NWK79433.1 chain length determinant protein tyrosine kinase EpsG [Aquitalea sp. LB_tupeE]
MNKQVEANMNVRGRSIGAILLDSGRLSMENAEKILRYQREHKVRFGEAAISLGILTDEDIQFALSDQYDYSYIQGADSRVSKDIIAAFNPFSPVAESMRALRSQLLIRWFSAEDKRFLCVVGDQRGDGRSFLAANLAVVFSQLGEKTLLVDADMRNPQLHALFGIENDKGLSTLLVGRASADEVSNKITGLLGLTVLPAGPIPPNPQELIAKCFGSQLIAWAKQSFDVVIIDTPAAAMYADAQAIASHAGGAVLVAREHVTEVTRLKQLAADISQVGAAVVGSVFNQF